MEHRIVVQKERDPAWGGIVTIRNGIVELAVSIDFGPRIFRYALEGEANMMMEDPQGTIGEGGEPFRVYGNNDGWKIRGGHRFWTSPEVMPRTYYPDNDPVETTLTESGAVFRAPVETWNQVRKEIEIALDPASSRVRVIHRLTNCGPWEVELAIWALSVMAPGGKAVIPQPVCETGYLPNRRIVLWPYSRMNDARVHWGERLIYISHDAQALTPFKLGLHNEDGWAAYANHGCLFIKSYEPRLDGIYPDMGASFEVYTNHRFTELETLGELVKLAPGQTTEHTEEWRLFRGRLSEDGNETADLRLISRLLQK